VTTRLAVIVAAFGSLTALSAELPSIENLPEAAIIRLGSTRFVHNGRITAVAFSPAGKIVATGTEDGFVHLWQSETGRELRHWRHDPHNSVYAIQFSRDGKCIASAGFNGVVNVWDLEGRRILSRPSQSAVPAELAWLSEDRLAILYLKNGTSSICTITRGNDDLSWSTGLTNLAAVCSSTDGKRLFVSDFGGKIKCFDAEKGTEHVTFDRLVAQPDYYRKHGLLAITADGKTLVSDGPGISISLWNTETGKIQRQIDNLERFTLLAAAPNGRFLAAHGSDGNIRIYGLASGRELRSFPARRYSENVMAISTDGRWLAEASCGRRLRIWDVVADKELHAGSGHGVPVYGVAFISGGKIVTAGEDQTVQCWDVATGKETDRIATQTFFETLVASWDGKGVLLRRDAEPSLVWWPGSQESAGLAMNCPPGAPVTFAPDGRSMAIQDEHTLTISAVPSGMRICEIPRRNDGYAPALSPDGRWAVFTENNDTSTIHIYDLVQKRLRIPITGRDRFRSFVNPKLFSPDARLLVSLAKDQDVHVWEVITGLPRATIPRPKHDGLTRFPTGAAAFAFSPDSRFLAFEANGALLLHDFSSGQTAGPFSGHRGRILGIAFSADGSRLATSGQDSTTLVWDVTKLCTKLPNSSGSAASAAQIESWWNDLASPEPGTVVRAIWSLAYRPDQALAIIREKSRPVLRPKPEDIERWIKDLGDARFAVREKATQQLAALGDAVRPALTDALKTASSIEARARISRLIETTSGRYSPAQLQLLRTVEVLEKIGGTRAREQLESLAHRTTDDELRIEMMHVLKRWK